MARNPATPSVAAPTPANRTGSQRFIPGGNMLGSHPTDRTIRTAKTRSKTSSGCTTARLPKLRATTCKAKAARFVTIAISHNGCLAKSSRIAGDSARSVLTRLVLRWSATDDIPKSSAATRAVTTATVCISSSGRDRSGRCATHAWASSELHARFGEAASHVLVICSHGSGGGELLEQDQDVECDIPVANDSAMSSKSRTSSSPGSARTLDRNDAPACMATRFPAGSAASRC
ncbi:MAG: hypothetical protein QOG28_7069 [Trebonia sp.]|nr:hypothetical protein [Trebonia sp.]